MDREAIHILLVEDSETHATLIRDALESGHIPVKLTVAQNLAEARDCLSESTPHLAIIDLFLPDGNGTELLPPQEEEPAYPAVIMSSQGDEQAAVEAMKAGVVDYVIKSSAMLAEMPRMVERVLREWRHIAERKQAQEELRERDQQYQAFFENNYAVMLLIDPESATIVDANPAACSFYGYAREELTQMKISDINTLPPDQIFREMERARSEQKHCFHFQHRLSSGTVRDVEVFSGPSTVRGKNLLCSIIHDITERKQAEEKLKEINRELDDFAYTVSHDLRTPLTLIIGYADFLQESCRDRLDEKALDCLTEISTSGERMMALMEDLLTLAKVGQVERPTEPFDAGEVVNDVVCGLAEIITQAGMSVSVGDLPTLRIPKTLLSQIFDNFIGNAIRYTGKEGSPIEVGGERRMDMVRLYVRDHGPGIPREERSRIFEVFFRGTTGKMVRGTGVGLAIVQKIARLYGGRAWVEETPGGGCTFWVEIEDVTTVVENENAARRP